MKHIEYSYDLYSKLGRMEGNQISQDKYNEVISTLQPTQEWETRFKNSTLYAKKYQIIDYTLFIWKEVFD